MMSYEVSEEVRDKIVDICIEFNINMSEFVKNHINPIFSKYQFMIDNQQNRKLMNDDIINYIDNEFLPVKRDKRLRELGI